MSATRNVGERRYFERACKEFVDGLIVNDEHGSLTDRDAAFLPLDVIAKVIG